MPLDELDRLFLRLVQAVRDARPEYLSRAFEVGELLGFVSYASVRSEVGFETNDDYGHAISRLLAGERGYLFADELMQDDLRAELASPNPDLAAYRVYANARVTLALEPTRKALEAMGPPTTAAPAPPQNPESASAPPRPTAEASRSAAPRPISPPAPRPLDPSAAAPQRPSRPGCRYCGQPLPEARDVHFCPSCGQNLRVRRCGACSVELEAGWKFCVSCGRAADA